MIATIGDQTTIQGHRMKVLEVVQETDANGDFAFATANCALRVQRYAGDALGPVSGDAAFCGYVLQGIDDATLYSVGFYDAEYGEAISDPQVLPVNETFILAWRAGQITVQEAGTTVAEGTPVDIILSRHVPEVGTVLQVYLALNSSDPDNATYKTDANGVVKWQHPDFGAVLPYFPKGVGALCQRVGDVDWNGAAPTEYLEEVRCYYKGAYVVMQEGMDTTLEKVGGQIESPPIPGGFVGARFVCGFAPGDDLHAWTDDGIRSGPNSYTRKMVGGVPVEYLWFAPCVNFGSYNTGYTVSQVGTTTPVSGMTSVSLSTPDTARNYLGNNTVGGRVFGWNNEPLSGVAIWRSDGNVFEQVAISAADGSWSHQIDKEASWYYIHDPTWGTWYLQPDDSSFIYLGTSNYFHTRIGLRFCGGIWGYTEAGRTFEDHAVGSLFTLPNLPAWAFGAAQVKNNRTGQFYGVDQSGWGAWQTTEILPCAPYLETLTAVEATNATYMHFPAEGVLDTFSLYLGGTLHGALPGAYVTAPLTVVSGSDDIILGGLIHGHLLQENARQEIADVLTGAKAWGLEHGTLHWPMRSTWTPSGATESAGSQLARECPTCRRQVRVEPGPLRGYCPVDEADARTYFDSYPLGADVSGHRHIRLQPYGVRRPLPLTYFYRQQAHSTLGIWAAGVFTPGLTASSLVTAYGLPAGTTAGLRPKVQPPSGGFAASGTYEMDVTWAGGAGTGTVVFSVAQGSEEIIFVLPRRFADAEGGRWQAGGLVEAVTALRLASGASCDFTVVADCPSVFDCAIPITNQTRTPYALPLGLAKGSICMYTDPTGVPWAAWIQANTIYLARKDDDPSVWHAAWTIDSSGNYDVVWVTGDGHRLCLGAHNANDDKAYEWIVNRAGEVQSGPSLIGN